MADRLEDLLRACVVRVTSASTSGAGFFVAPGRVLTCVHVAGTGEPPAVRWERDGRPSADFAVSDMLLLADRGRPIPALACDYPDIAVLTVSGITDHPCIAVDGGWPGSADHFQAFGYPAEGGAVLLTPARLTYRGLRGTWPTLFLDLGWDIVRRGMSGAPVLNLRTGGVCGVVVASRDPQQPAGALAVPWSAIATNLDEVMAANAAFHRRDKRWITLLQQLAGGPAAAGAVTGPGATGAAAGGAFWGTAGWAAGSRHGSRPEQAHPAPDGSQDDDDHHHQHHEGDDEASGDPGAYRDDDDSAPDADDGSVDLSETDDDDLW